MVADVDLCLFARIVSAMAYPAVLAVPKKLSVELSSCKELTLPSVACSLRCACLGPSRRRRGLSADTRPSARFKSEPSVALLYLSVAGGRLPHDWISVALSRNGPSQSSPSILVSAVVSNSHYAAI